MNRLIVKKSIDDIFQIAGEKLSIENLNYKKYLRLSKEDKEDVKYALFITLKYYWMEGNKKLQNAKYNIDKAFHRNIEDEKTFLKVAYVVNRNASKFNEYQKRMDRNKRKSKGVSKIKTQQDVKYDRKIEQNIRKNKKNIMTSLKSMIGLDMVGILSTVTLSLTNAVVSPYIYGIIVGAMMIYTVNKTIKIVSSRKKIKQLEREGKLRYYRQMNNKLFEEIDIEKDNREKFDKKQSSNIGKASFSMNDCQDFEKTSIEERKPAVSQTFARDEFKRNVPRYNSYTDYRRNSETTETKPIPPVPVFDRTKRRDKIIPFTPKTQNINSSFAPKDNQIKTNDAEKHLLIFPESYTYRRYTTNQTVSEEEILYQRLSEREKELCLQIKSLKESIAFIQNQTKHMRESAQMSHIELYNKKVDLSYVDYYAQRRKLKKELEILEAEYQVCVMSLNSLDRQIVNNDPSCKEYMKKYSA